MIVKYIQRKRIKGWSLHKECERLGIKRENVVFCGRGTKWGNPYKNKDKKVAVKDFEITIRNTIRQGNIKLEKDIKELKGKTLMCWCSLDDFNNGLCHCSVLYKIANEDKEDE